MVHGYLPLAVAVGLLALPALASASSRLDVVLSRLSLSIFGPYVRLRTRANAAQRRALRAAHVDETYNVYAARTFLYAAVAALAGSILGVYVVWGTLLVLGVPESALRGPLPSTLSFLAGLLTVPELSATELFAVLLASNATLGVVFGLTTYQARWWLPRLRAEERQRKVDESMERTVAFVYALSRSGMAFPKVMAILSRNRAVYGEAAAEMAVAVREMELLGTDVLTALERAARRTPSESFEEFAENLTSVLRSGQSLSSFLTGQYERYKEESEAQQQQFLDLLGTLAEAYVTILVAGPLFLITILVIVGLVLGGTLPFLQTFAYFLIPAATLGFLAYLDGLDESPDVSRREWTAEDGWGLGRLPGGSGDRGTQAGPGGSDGRASRADGGFGPAAETVARLRAFNRVRWLRARLSDPAATLTARPVRLLYVTVPLAVVYVAVRGWSLAAAGRLGPSTVDDVLVHATLFVTATFAVVAEVHRFRVRRVEAAVPDLLDRLASVNAAGTPIGESIGRVAHTDLGALGDEVDRIWREVQWGARVEHALYRFERRVGTVSVTRVVTLVTNAMTASGDLGPVLRIAADQAQAARRLQRERRQELFTYLVVIYLSFLVFLTIIVAMSAIFLPAIPTGDGVSGELASTVGNITRANKGAYELVFFHTAVVQAVCSGLVAGKMGEGSVAAGAKHAAFMLGLAYAAMLLLG